MAVDAAELHGSLCAQAGVLEGLDPERWLGLALGRAVDVERLSPDLRASLEWLFDWTLEALADPQFGFELLLPDDEQAMTERAAALARWCGGFVSGYGAAVAGTGHALSADAREVLSDLSEIAQADVEAEGGEEDEAAYAELIEYARVGAMLIYEGSRGPGPDEATH